MKFALRDDDLNWFFTPEFIERQLSDIWDSCPVSMSAIPSVIGNWARNTRLLDKHGPKTTPQDLIQSIQADKKIYKIGDNKELVEYVKEKIRDKKVYITIHGITHRNNDSNLPYLKNNFGIGAEFFTTRNLASELIDAKIYLEEVFGQDISVFTPPQNALSKLGMNAVQKAGLNICGDIPSLRSPNFYLSQLGLINYIRVLSHRLTEPKYMPYPKVLNMREVCMNSHCRIQPKTSLDKIKSELEYVYKKKGNFVLSTHSFGFDLKMENHDMTLKEGVIDIIKFAKRFPRVEFVSLNNIFKA